MKTDRLKIASLVLWAGLLSAPILADTTTLTVQDGMDAAANATLSSLGEDTQLNANDDANDVLVGKGTNLSDNQWIAIRLNGTIPAGHTIQSVVIEFERQLNGPASKSGTLYLDVSTESAATLWGDATRGNETGQGTHNQTFAVSGTNNFVLETYDVSSFVDSVPAVQNLELLFRNDSGSFKEIYLDFVRVVVTHADLTAPDAVTNLAGATTLPAGDVRLSWTSPGNDGLTGTLNNSTFSVQYALTAGASWSPGSAQIMISTSGVNPGSSQFATESLDPNTTYYFRIWTTDDAGNVSGQSNLASTVTYANAVSNITVKTVNQSSVTVTWNDLPVSPQSNSAEGYVLEGSSTNFDGTGTIYSSQTANVSLSTLTLSGLNPNATYYFRVGSLNWVGMANYAAGPSSSTLSIAPGVGSPSFTGVAISSVSIQWTDGGNPAGTTYVAEISDDNFGSVYSSASTAGLSVAFGTGGIGADLNPNTTYTARVKSLNNNDVSSAYRLLGSTATLAVSPGLATPVFTQVEISSISIQWQDANNPAGTTYVAEISTDNFNTVYASSQTQNPNATFQTLDSNTTHWVRVKSLNYNQVSSSFTVFGATSTISQFPTSPQFSAVYASSVTVDWTVPAFGAEGYRLRASSTSFDGSGTIHSTQTFNGSSAALTVDTPALSPNTTYFFRLGSFNWNGVLNETSIGGKSTLANGPDSPSIGSVFVTSVTVAWSQPAGSAEGYRLEASTASDFNALLLTSATPNGSLTSLTVAGLVSDTTYYFRVGSFNWEQALNFTNAGSTTTASSEDTIPPDKILDLTITTQTATGARLTWTAPFDPTDNPLNGNYRIQYSTDAGVQWSTSAAQVVLSTSNVSPGSSQTREVSDLLPNTTYHFRIWTSDLKPNWSSASDISANMTLSNPVTDGTLVSQTSQTLTYIWTPLPVSPSSSSAAGYRLGASSTGFNGTGGIVSTQTINGSSNSLQLENLEPNTTYSIRLGSLNHKLAPNPASISPVSTLAKDVSRLGADFVSIFTTSATLQWAGLPSAPPSETSEGYRLEASSTNFSGTGAVRFSSTSDHAVSTLTVSGLTADTTYYFRVGSLNWTSTPNFVALSATSTLAEQPTSPNVISISTRSATLSWGLPPTASAGFTLQASDVPDFSTLTASSSTVNGTRTSLTVTGLSANTTTYFRAGSLNWNGVPHFAASLSSVTLAIAPERIPPDFTSIYSSSATARWKARPAAPSDQTSEGYRLEVSTDSGFAGTIDFSSTTNVANSTLTVVNLSPSTTYYFRAGSLNWTGVPNFTLLDSTVTRPVQPAYAASTFTAVSITSVTAQWSSNGNGAGTTYELSASTAADFTGTLSFHSTENLSADLTSLTPNTTYFARVRAKNAANQTSPFLNLSSTITKANLPGSGSPVFTPVGTSSLTVNITAGSPVNPAGTVYEIQISTNGSFVPAVSSVTTSLSATYASLTPNTTFFARARAQNAAGTWSAYSDLGSTATLAVPPGTAVSTFTNLSNSGFTLNWSSGSPASGFNTSGTLYRAQISESATFVSITDEKSVAGLSIEFSGLLSGTLYYARVLAVNHQSVETAYTSVGSTATLPSSVPVFKTGTFQVTDSLGTYIDPSLYTDTTTVTVRVTVQSAELPGLAVTDTPGMEAIWHFDETGTTAFDASRHNHDVTLQGSPVPSRVAGHTGTALDFDGSQSYAITSSMSPWRVDAANNVWSIELWFKATNNDDKGYIVQTANQNTSGGSHDGEITWDNTSGNLKLSLKQDSGNPNTTYEAAAGSAYDDNQWHYLAAVLNTSGAFLFIDGLQVASNATVNSTNARTYTTGNAYVWIGAGTKQEGGDGNNSRFYSGLVDDVRLSTVGLTSQQVAQNFNLGKAGHRWGSPDLDVSIQEGADFTWTRMSTAAVSVSGTNGTTAEQIFTVGGINLVQTQSPGASTNKVTFLASDLGAGVATGQYVILVDTMPPANVGLTSLTEPTTGGWTVNAQTASDSPSGLASLPYLFEASTDSAFTVINASSNYISANFHVFSTLDPNTTYFFRVKARDAAGNESAYSSSLSSSTLSNAVSGVSLSQVYETSATVSWTALPPTPPDQTSEGYRLDASSTDFDGSGVVRSSATANASLNSLTVPNLSPNTTYYFRVGSLNWNGGPHYASAGSTSTLAGKPASPSFVSVFATSATVAWGVPGGGAGGYRLDASTYSDFSSAVTSSETSNGSLTQLTVGNLSPNTTTYFRVGSINWDGALNISSALSTGTLSNPPQNVAFDSVYITSATLSWSPPAGGSAGFEIQASTASDFTGTIQSTATANAGRTDLTVLNLDPNATYYFRAGSFNWNGREVFAAGLSTNTLANAPVAPQFSAVYFTSATLSWSIPAGGASGYRLEASTHADFSNAVASSQTSNGGLTALTISSLSSNATTYVRVGSINGSGGITFAQTLSTSTLAGAPGGVSISQIYVSSVTLTWTLPAGGAAGFRIEASTAVDFTGTIESSVTANGAATSLTVLSLQSNTSIHFRVASLNWNNQAVYADSLSTTTLAEPPIAPSFTAVYFSSVTLSWSVPAGGTSGYRIDASTAADFTGTVESTFTSNGNRTSLTVSNLGPNSTYFFRVGSRNQNNVFNFSGILSTSTLAGPPENVAFDQIFESSATLSWSPPAGGSSGYQINASTSSDFTGTVESTSTPNGSRTTLSVLNLNPNATYYFRVGSRNWNDNLVFANALSTSTLANVPDSPIFSTVHLSSVVLQWNLPASGANGYRADASTAADFSGVLRSSLTADGSSTQIAVSNLDSNTTYYFRVGSLNWNDVPRYAAAGSTSTLAQPVLRLIPDFLAVYPASATVRWQARPASPLNATAEGYRLEASSTGFDGTGVVSIAATSDVSESTLTSTSLLPNTTYTFRVGALNWNGVPSYTVMPATGTLANAVGSPAFSQVDVSSAVVSWSLPSGGAEGYRVEAATTPDFTGLVESSETANGSRTSLTVVSLVSNTSYYFRVGSRNWNFAANYTFVGSTQTRSSVDPIGPDAVTDLVASADSNTSVRLIWSAPSDPTDNPLSGAFIIQYATFTAVTWSTTTAQITVSTSGVVPNDQQTHLINSLDPNTTYYARIWTQDSRPNTSPLSNGATIATLANIPSGLSFVSVDETSSTLSWAALPASPSSASAFGYLLQASTDSTFQLAVHSTQTSNGSLSSLSVLNLDRNTTYFYRVGSLNRANAANFTASLSTSTLGRKPNRLASDFVAVYQTSATLHWEALSSSPSSESAEGYRLEASSTNFAGAGAVWFSSTTDSAVSTRTVFNLDGNTTFYFRVGSLNWNGVPNYTTLDSTSTLGFVPGLAPPAFSMVGVTSVTAHWTANGNPNGTGYRFELSTTSDFAILTDTISTQSLSTTQTGLDPNVTYYARVSAVNHNGISSAYLDLNSTMTRTADPGTVSPAFDPVHPASFTVSYSSGSPANPTGTYYDVEISTESSFSSTSSSRTLSLSAAFSNLLINTTYFARVKSENGLGLFSSYANLGSTVTRAVPPGPAASTFTNIGNRSFTLNWSSGTAATGFDPAGTVYIAEISTASNYTGSVSQTLTTNLSVTFSGLDFGTTYYARVKAQNHLGIETVFVDYGYATTTPSSEPIFIGGTFQITNSSGAYIDGTLYTDTATINARVNVQSSFAPGLAITDTPGYLATWHFDEGSGADVQDSSLHGHSLTLNGSPQPTWANALLGHAVDFDGAQNYAVSADLQPWRKSSDNNSWTVELWFKTGSNTGYLFQTSNKNAGSPSNFDLDIGWHNTSGNLSFALRTSAGQQRIAESNQTYADNNWHHLAAVLDSSGMYLYVDGSEVASNTNINTSSAKTYSSTIYAWIGGANLLDSNIGNGSQYAPASVDEVRISTLGFSADQVGQSYQLNRVQGHPLGGPSIDVSTTAGADFTWVRLSTADATLTGSNGTTSAETFTGLSIDLTESASGADTNQILFLATDLDGNVTTAQFQILVDTTPPSNVGINSLSNVATGQIQSNLLIASDTLSGLSSTPYWIEISSSQSFDSVLSSTGWINQTTALFTGLDPNTTYYFRSRARDAVGRVSDYSSVVATPTLANTVPDAAVSDVQGSTVTVSWTPHPVSPSSQSARGYLLQTSTESNFNSIIKSSQTPNGSRGSLTLTGLQDQTTYYFRVGSLNWADVPNFAPAGSTRTVDGIAPAAINTVSALPGQTGETVHLSWTAPGDDGSTGLINNGKFLVQFTTDTAFAQSSSWDPVASYPSYVSRVSISTMGVTPDTTQAFSLTGLIGGGTYYVRVWTQDDAGNISDISNGATTYATPAVLGVSLSTDTLVFGSLPPGTTVLAGSSITVTNTGNVTQAFGLRLVEPAVWTSTSASPGVDTFRLTGLFKDNQPNLSDFGVTEDVILTSTSTPTSSAFAVAGDPISEKGFNVTPSESRTLWIRIEVPPITSTDGDQIIRLKAVAIKE